MKKVLLLICLALLLSIAPCLVGTSLGKVTKTVKVNVNGKLLYGDPSDSNHPSIYIRTNNAAGDNVTIHSTSGQNSVAVEYWLTDYLWANFYAKATLPNGQWQTYTYTGPQDITFNFTCDPSNKIVMKNYFEGTMYPVNAYCELREKKSGEFKLIDTEWTDSTGKVTFTGIKRDVEYQVIGRQLIGTVQSTHYLDKEHYNATIFNFSGDFQTNIHVDYYKRIGENKPLGSGIKPLPSPGENKPLSPFIDKKKIEYNPPQR